LVRRRMAGKTACPTKHKNVETRGRRFYIFVRFLGTFETHVFSRVVPAVSPACRFSMPEYKRRLPHLHPEGCHLFLTWRLWGSLPVRMPSPGDQTPGQAFAAIDRATDRLTSGPLWLRDHRIADLVSRSILIGASERRFYDLCAWVVMPNHVHLLILPLVPVPSLMRWLKGSTARSANRILDRTGQRFWQDESFDHYLRGSHQLERTAAYIERNPVSAGLVCAAERWPWSSAGWQAKLSAPQSTRM
jgi:REP element-mobilizing transposase RayT